MTVTAETLVTESPALRIFTKSEFRQAPGAVFRWVQQGNIARVDDDSSKVVIGWFTPDDHPPASLSEEFLAGLPAPGLGDEAA